MLEEMGNLEAMETWEVMKRPLQVNVVGNKWVFAMKTGADGSIRFKARLVAQGFTQMPGMPRLL